MTLRVLSLGAGVQSTTLALMAAHGEFDHVPDAAIFADTGWEPASVYRHVWWLTEQLPFPVYIVSNGNIRASLTSREKVHYAAVPFFLDTPKGRGMGQRQCTKEFKVTPLTRMHRQLLGYPARARIPAGAVEVWIGISLDEATRMKPSGNTWQVHRWPLIEKRMTRTTCLQWLAYHGYPKPPKSACIGCPFHSNSMWREMRDHDPEAWADAVAVDKIIRDSSSYAAGHSLYLQYMHGSLVPLDQAFLGDNKDQLNLFENECEGMCGV